MKQLLSFLLLPLLALCAVSCGNDDPNNIDRSKLIGTWYSDDPNGGMGDLFDAPEVKEYIHFNDDGTGVSVSITHNPSWLVDMEIADEIEIETGSCEWELQGNRLILKANEINVTSSGRIISLTDKTLKYEAFNIVVTSKKVPYSEIEQYL